MSNLNINKVVLGGHLTADVELKQTPSGVSVCQFSIAVNRRFSRDGERQTDFITCQAWRQTAEFIARYFRKGSALCVCGSIQTRSWTDSGGQKRYATEIVVDEAYFVDSRSDGQGAADTNTYIPDAYAAPGFAGADKPSFETMSADDDLPF
ncbi:MAG: single-stranded DNA-binding protein [Clostridia bacterium]|nr:single-stranded DNA-binding protein [Clostridia bacterium]MBQ8836477.1 single-stranded DNA-binding protein [Clostridia bacterium]